MRVEIQNDWRRGREKERPLTLSLTDGDADRGRGRTAAGGQAVLVSMPVGEGARVERERTSGGCGSVWDREGVGESHTRGSTVTVRNCRV